MNVFVLCTGRCGSLTFAKACAHITNYSTGHETNIGKLGLQRTEYPDNHIEVDNRLSWFLGRLDETYGDNAFYVHLVRDKRATAMSFEKRAGFGIMAAYRDGVYLGLSDQHTTREIAEDYYVTVNANIKSFLRDKNRQFTIELENLVEKFSAFWLAIGADGNMNMALSELNTRHNVS